MNKFLPATLLAISTAIAAPLSHAAYLLPGGDFESGDFFGWVPGTSLGGISEIVYQGTCFSGNDTTGITLYGQASAKLRSNQAGQIESGASITSELFTAGSAISFAALTEVPFGQSSEYAVYLTVSVLDAEDNEIMSHRIDKTGAAVLTPGCPNSPANGEFTGHLIDTNLFEGQAIKVRFRQSTNRAGFGLFTLIDDVFVYEPGEIPILQAPLARAGTRYENGELILDATASTHPVDIAMSYEWFISGFSGTFEGSHASLANLDQGNYLVVLFAKDGLSVSSDTMLLGIPPPVAVQPIEPPVEPEPTDGESTNTSNNITSAVNFGGSSIDFNSIGGESGTSDSGDGSDAGTSDSSSSTSSTGTTTASSSYDDGYQDGYQDGSDGSDDNYQDGFDDGYDNGFNQGYDQGHDDGVFDCENMLNGFCP